MAPDILEDDLDAWSFLVPCIQTSNLLAFFRGKLTFTITVDVGAIDVGGKPALDLFSVSRSFPKERLVALLNEFAATGPS
jgi:hypothetical protein